MNPPDSVSPRRFCRMIRGLCAFTRDPQKTASKHCESCASCRAYFATDQKLEQVLKRDALAIDPELPAGLDRRIQLEIERIQPRGERSRHRAAWALTGLAVGGLAAVAVLRIQAPRIDPVQPTATIQDVVAVAKTFPPEWLSAVQPNAAKLVENNSLQTEIASVQSDARSALNFLTINFLPTNASLPSKTAEASHSG